MRWRAEQLRDSTRQPSEHVARPSYAVIHRIFASWDAALTSADVQPLGGRNTRSNERTRRTDGYRYTDEQLLDAVRDAHEAMGWPLTGRQQPMSTPTPIGDGDRAARKTIMSMICALQSVSQLHELLKMLGTTASDLIKASDTDEERSVS